MLPMNTIGIVCPANSLRLFNPPSPSENKMVAGFPFMTQTTFRHGCWQPDSNDAEIHTRGPDITATCIGSTSWSAVRYDDMESS